MKNLQRTPSEQSSTYKKYSPTTTASSSSSILMFKQKRKWEISGASLETVESNVALSVSAQTNLANMGDNDTCPQMANNMISSSETTLHHHHHHHYPSISPSDSLAPGEVGKTVQPSSGNSFTSTSMFKQKHKWESSLGTVESNIDLGASPQSNLDRNNANMGDNDTCPQMANNISSSETTLHHHHYPSISQSHCNLENSDTSLEPEEKMLKQKCRFE